MAGFTWKKDDDDNFVIISIDVEFWEYLQLVRNYDDDSNDSHDNNKDQNNDENSDGDDDHVDTNIFKSLSIGTVGWT